MLRIDIKTYNSLLLHQLLKELKTNLKFKNLANFTLLPSKRKDFVIKKSPHVFGRSKEKYYLNTHLCVITLNIMRRKDLLDILKIFNLFKYKEGLGLKFTIFGM